MDRRSKIDISKKFGACLRCVAKATNRQRALFNYVAFSENIYVAPPPRGPFLRQ